MTARDDAQSAAVSAAAAGFTGQALTTIVAIAGAESGWNPQAVNLTSSETPFSQKDKRPCASWGLTQINNCPDRDSGNESRGGANPQVLLDPYRNMVGAYAISGGGTNFAPWSTFKPIKGKPPKYLAHMDMARNVVKSLNKMQPDIDKVKASGRWPWDIWGSKDIGLAGRIARLGDLPAVAVGLGGEILERSPLSPLAALADLVAFVVNPRNWMRVLGAIVGLQLVVGGLVLLALELTGTTGTVARVATGAATGGTAGAATAAATPPPKGP